MRHLLLGSVVFLALAGCRAGLEDATFATGSQTAIGSADHASIYAVNVDEGTVSRVTLATGVVTTVEVGREPTRLARVGNRVYVTLRAERAVAVLEETGGALVMVDRFEVGAEPYGIVADEAGTRLYVALSQQDEVVAIDPASYAVLGRWSVEGAPSWLALHPSGDTLFVASQLGGRLSSIAVTEPGANPKLFAFTDPFGAGDDRLDTYTRRFTGDMAFSPDGTTLSVPGLWVDNRAGEATTSAADIAAGLGSQYYTSDSSLTLSRMNPGLLLVDTDRGGGPRAESGRAVFVAGSTLLSDTDELEIVRSYIVGVTWAPDGATMYASMEASRTVVALSSAAVYPGESLCQFCVSSNLDSGAIFPGDGGFLESPSVQISTDYGPRSVVFTGPDEAWVHSFLDRSVAGLPLSTVTSKMQDQVALNIKDETAATRALTSVRIAEASLGTQVEEGRRLFYSAITSSMAGTGAGVSCSTCHTEGRNDGLTWPLSAGPRQTPSLAGKVSETTPVTWTDGVADAGAEANLTATGRMGGSGLSAEQRSQIVKYIDSVRMVDRVERGVATDAVARGKAIFEREDVACASCHSGSRFTDNEPHDLYGVRAVNTPPLTGVAATAPYLHDGAAATLRAVLETGRTRQMGDTSMLSEADLDDLEAYLRSM